MGLYQVDKLMSETRKLAAEFRRATGSTLPVTPELARYDACRLLALEQKESLDQGIDAIGTSGTLKGQKIHIKGRVLFDSAKKVPKLGQLNLDNAWDVLAVVLMDSDYNPTQIIVCPKDTLLNSLSPQNRNNPKSSISVAKLKSIGQAVWHKKAA